MRVKGGGMRSLMCRLGLCSKTVWVGYEKGAHEHGDKSALEV